MFSLPFIADGLVAACLARMKRKEHMYTLGEIVIPHVNMEWIMTCDKGMQSIERMLLSAQRTIHICAFIFRPDKVFPSGLSVAHIINAKAAAGVEVKIMMNSTGEYTNLSPSETRHKLHPNVKLYSCRFPKHELNVPFINQTGYAYMHMKFCCVDRSNMQIGWADLEPFDRVQYNHLNQNGFSWHEIGVRFACTAAIADSVDRIFCCSHTVVCPPAPPLPLVSGGPNEAHIMCRMIDAAQAFVYIEHQVICMGPSEDLSVQLILEALAHKVAFIPNFKVVIITNLEQDDEYNYITRKFSCVSLQSTIVHMRTLVQRMMGHAGLEFDEDTYRQNVHYLKLVCSGGESMKTHSNTMIVDTAAALRSSSNLTSRSLGVNPCDMELGIVTIDGVENLLHGLLRLHCPLMQGVPSISKFLDMVDSGLSHAKRAVVPELPMFMVDLIMSVSHLHPGSGHCKGRMLIREV